MSALGQKQTCAVQEGMSAFHPIATAKADIGKIGSRISRCAVVDRTANKSCKTDCKIVGQNFAKHWSGRRESNPRMQLGKLPFYH